ncbi:hypothetical protein AB1Y20_002626 [Prymnesium parvum]|uniref:Gfo/Idh/MocA-like oxidoreductase N-terminal domain-containing protein n=1 Tax=Prymnesium parvum TaxID=97485 RepID=A0AB34J9M0_PRYPA
MARIAVVGCGGWTQGWHLPHLSRRDDATIAALVDPLDQPGVGGCTPSLCLPMAQLCAKYGAPRFTSVDALLAEAATLRLDGVLVAVPHPHHYAVARAVLAAGLHLLLEKPLTADAAEAIALARLAAAAGSPALLVNNTANWRRGSRAALEAVASGRLGAVRLVNCVFGAPLGWLFEGEAHAAWAKPSGTMRGNGVGWGQLPHALAWVFKVSGLVPRRVYAAAAHSEASGADLYDALTISCEGGATVNVSGVGACPDHGFKVVGNWIFGTEGMLSYCGHAGSDNVKAAEAAGGGGGEAVTPTARLELWRHDGTHEVGPPVEFEDLEQGGTGPGSLDAFVAACAGKPYFNGAGVAEGLKAVLTIDAMYRSIASGLPEDVLSCDDVL